MTQNLPCPTKRHELVFATVDVITKTKFFFRLNEFLKGKKITGLTAHPNSYVTQSPLGETLVTSTLVTNRCFLTLKTTKGVEIINQLPMYLLCAGVNTGGTYEKSYPIDDLDIDWEQSYITVSAPSVLTAATVFMLSVLYKEDGDTCTNSKN